MSEKRSIQTMSIDGNCLCFNFINTVHSRAEGEEPFEYLSSYGKLMEWCQQLEVMPPERIKNLSVHADAHQEEAIKSLESMIESREMLYRFFSNIAAGDSIGDAELQAFNKLLARSLANLRFVTDTEDLQLGWKNENPDLKEPLWRVMKSAYDILTEEPFDRIKECEACGWVFLDQSKNKSRRWCNMQSCGSIHKAKKYYHRKVKRER